MATRLRLLSTRNLPIRVTRTPLSRSGQRVTAFQCGQFLFQVHGDYSQRDGSDRESSAITGSRMIVTKARVLAGVPAVARQSSEDAIGRCCTKLSARPAAIQMVMFAPTLFCIKRYRIPVTLQTLHARNFAGQAAELPGAPALGCRRKRITGIKYEINERRAYWPPTPRVPFKVLQFTIRRSRLP